MRPSLFFLLPLFLAIPVMAYMVLRFGDQAPPSKDATSTQLAVEQAAEEQAEQAANSPEPPATLVSRITKLGAAFDGDVGIVVHSVAHGWTATHDADRRYPQQSVSKLWIAATVLDKIDDGEVSLVETIPLSASDLSIFHQPIRKKILAGDYRPTISELLRYAMTQSDNAANAALFRRVGGQAGVLGFLRDKGLDDIAMSEGEKELQMGIAGLAWQDSFSYGRNFWREREKLSFGKRTIAMGEYLENPPDGATPRAIAEGLVKLQRGALLSPRSSAYLIDLMAQSRSGPNRLRGGLAEGWTMPHKTGTGQVLKALATAYNDVGLLVSPSGQHYAVVVMIGATNRPVPERQALMHNIVRAVIACEEDGVKGCSGLSTMAVEDGTNGP